MSADRLLEGSERRTIPEKWWLKGKGSKSRNLEFPLSSDPGSRIGHGHSKSGSKALLAVRKKGEVFVYINSCPHIGVPLDFVPGNFLDLNKEYILCSSHGALFRISDGYCISGPCLGKNLQPVASKIEGGQIILIL